MGHRYGNGANVYSNQAKFGPGGCGRQGEITSRPAYAEHSLLLIRVLGHGITEAQTNGENGVECGQHNGMDGNKACEKKGSGETSTIWRRERDITWR